MEEPFYCGFLKRRIPFISLLHAGSLKIFGTVAHMNALALTCGKRLALIGDINAAPEGVKGAILCIARLVKQIVLLWIGFINAV